MKTPRRALLAVALIASLLASACGSDDSASTTTTAPVMTPSTTAPTISSPTTPVTSLASPPTTVGTAAVEDVTFEQLRDALPDLVTTTDAANHVIELQLRTIEVRVGGGELCIGGGVDAPEPDTCVALADGAGVLTYSDNSTITRIYAVLTAADVAVEFVSTGGPLTCFTEPARLVGAMAVSWCEDQFAPVIRFITPDGKVRQVTIG